jgi:hypothetical protein
MFTVLDETRFSYRIHGKTTASYVKYETTQQDALKGRKCTLRLVAR